MDEGNGLCQSEGGLHNIIAMVEVGDGLICKPCY